jgi:hypothetical protein
MTSPCHSGVPAVPGEGCRWASALALLVGLQAQNYFRLSLARACSGTTSSAAAPGRWRSLRETTVSVSCGTGQIAPVKTLVLYQGLHGGRLSVTGRQSTRLTTRWGHPSGPDARVRPEARPWPGPIGARRTSAVNVAAIRRAGEKPSLLAGQMQPELGLLRPKGMRRQAFIAGSMVLATLVGACGTHKTSTLPVQGPGKVTGFAQMCSGLPDSMFSPSPPPVMIYAQRHGQVIAQQKVPGTGGVYRFWIPPGGYVISASRYPPRRITLHSKEMLTVNFGNVCR